MHQYQRLHQLFNDVAQRMQLPYSLPYSDHTPMATLSLGSSIIPQLMACINAAKDVHDTCDRLQLPRDTSFSTEGSNDDWTAAHERQAQAWAEDVLNRIHDAAMKCTLSPAKADKGKKPKFKHEYTVLLDKYFEFNAYPSAPDKMMLARKSGMTARQIEVWFQNHRNRARREGRKLRRLSENTLPQEIPLKSLEHPKSFLAIPEHRRKHAKRSFPTSDKPHPSMKDTRAENEITLKSKTLLPDVLNPTRPDHAFPSVYRPSSDIWAASSEVYKFSPPVWPRKPASRRPNIESLVNMAEFILDFNRKLHLRAPVSPGALSKENGPWCAFRSTVLPSAPHPALVQVRFLDPMPEPSSPPLPFTIFSASGPLQARDSPYPGEKNTGRNIGRPAKCISKSMPSAFHCTTSPALRNPSSPAISRSWLSGSDVSLRRSSSSPNVSPLSSSEPSTPVIPHVSIGNISSSPLIDSWTKKIIIGDDYREQGCIFQPVYIPTPC